MHAVKLAVPRFSDKPSVAIATKMSPKSQTGKERKTITQSSVFSEVLNRGLSHLSAELPK
jgi:hypothetical protein